MLLYTITRFTAPRSPRSPLLPPVAADLGASWRCGCGGRSQTLTPRPRLFCSWRGAHVPSSPIGPHPQTPQPRPPPSGSLCLSPSIVFPLLKLQPPSGPGAKDRTGLLDAVGFYSLCARLGLKLSPQQARDTLAMVASRGPARANASRLLVTPFIGF